MASFYVDNTLGVKQPDHRRSLIAERYMQIVTRSRESTPSASDSGSPSSNYSGTGFPEYNANDPRWKSNEEDSGGASGSRPAASGSRPVSSGPSPVRTDFASDKGSPRARGSNSK